MGACDIVGPHAEAVDGTALAAGETSRPSRGRLKLRGVCERSRRGAAADAIIGAIES